MKFNLKRVSILFILLFSLFAIGSSAIETNVHTVSDDDLHLKGYTNEIQNLNEPYEYIKTDYFKPITQLHFTNKPVTRYYHLTLKKVKISPDGFERTVWSVNGQLPGPIIQANKGDRLVINVTNNFDDPASIHWHGMFQHGTNWYDGVPGQTQCPIPNDISFIYKFSTGNQHGTYWYHSHFFAQYVDGLRGGLIIHDKDDPYLKHYDYEYVVTLSDWHHNTTGVLLPLKNTPGYAGASPVPDSPLITGLGRYNCSAAPPGSKCKSNQPLPVYKVEKNKKYRFRIISTGAEGVFVFSIDQHKLKVIELEGVYVKPTIIKKLLINVGQRYSIIVNANQPIGNYFIRGTLDKRCSPMNNATINFNSAIDWNGLGILRYEGAKNTKPNSKEFNDDFKPCRDLEKKHLTPLESTTKYDGHVTDFFNITVTFGKDKNNRTRAFMNDVSFVPQMNDPTINKITRYFAPKDLPTEQNSLIFDNKDGIVELYLWNNNTAGHPFHMHGHVFAVMFIGEKGELPDESKYDKKNPIIRDTVTVPGNGYLVIRFISDNPGIWAFHCHIEWHVELGMVMQLVELPSILKNEIIPNDVVALCLENDLQKRRIPTLSAPAQSHRRAFNSIKSRRKTLSQ
ncbi:multicopper oxidase [Rhizophagus clarus]|uniref:Multicopper oxidase n=1 Tax=Rhizophagus clarus TaxID=94130 RepID=A0A8H3KR91_9GLOM|nr:multicopper oxidase [Rhizophagus clarus]